MTNTHRPRLMPDEVDPNANRAIYKLDQYVSANELDPGLYHLVNIRISQINGCFYCLYTHINEARSAGVDERRIDLLPTWREAGALYGDRESLALQLAEDLTLIADHHISDEFWNQLASNFTQKEILTLLVAIASMNVRNRIAIATQQVPNWN